MMIPLVVFLLVLLTALAAGVQKNCTALASLSSTPIDKSTPEAFHIVDSQNPKLAFYARWDEPGDIRFSARTRLPDGARSAEMRGADLFARMLKHFEAQSLPIERIQSEWYVNSGDVDNLNQVNELTGKSPIPLAEAALKTWTGRQAALHGFTRVVVRYAEGSPGKFTHLRIVFCR